MAALKKHRKLCLFLFTGMLCRYLLHICVQVSKYFTDFGGATWCQTPTFCIGSGPLPGLAFAENSREKLENSGWWKEENTYWFVEIIGTNALPNIHEACPVLHSHYIYYIYIIIYIHILYIQILSRVTNCGWSPWIMLFSRSPFTFWEHAWPIFEGNWTTIHWEEFCSQFASA